MLSDSTIREINRQIQDELRTIRLTSNPETKKTAFENIAKLQKLLEPTTCGSETPSRKTLLKELASAIIEAREETRNRNQPVDFWESIFGISRR